jgi:hypothetical protein
MHCQEDVHSTHDGHARGCSCNTSTAQLTLTFTSSPWGSNLRWLEQLHAAAAS